MKRYRWYTTKKGIEHDKDPKTFIEDPSDLKNDDQVFGVLN